MGIQIDFTHAHHEPCARCGGQDDAGGLELQDDQKVVKILCRKCTLELVAICLEPGGNGTRVALSKIDPGLQPELHRAAGRIANRIVFSLHRVLRQDEHEQVARSIYALAREEIEAMAKHGETTTPCVEASH